MKSGIELISEERKEQLEKHHISINADVIINAECQLSFAAALLCCPNPESHGCSYENNYACPDGWDSGIWFKIITKPYKQRLIIAGALIAAEIDRLNNTI